ncbi:MAG: NDP-sugar synthase [Nitrososphaerota archaeon]|uniref:NDP-sugar synthase n=1 Tax=Candidatus Bathycorpusculum sp. TaxID=2994959 RepID=UPI0028302B74|nr:NDP-sugar synthase [Candidatus Termitimicrobium sp.]MCL2432002.1 NDP-sugar synthase [Candidatus Termitimicrobium sp.]MDR0492915.1 NDP-sugar synthase [Nitrososphaerota archaeon]
MNNRYEPHVGDNYAPDKIRVIIPVGGKATRLLPLTAETSKACLRLLNRPLVEFSLLSLANQGIRNFIFGVKGYTNYRDLYDYFESGTGFSARYGIDPPIHIKYQPNVPDLGSADSARINMNYYEITNPVFAVQGDNIFDIKVKNIIDFHKEKEAALTIVLREVDNVEGLGIADIDKSGRIQKFIEKPQPKDAPSNLANTGLYVLSPGIQKIFKEKGIQQIIKNKNRLDFGYDFIPYVISTGRPVYGYTLKGSWYDVGTPKSYLEAMKNLLHSGVSTLKDFGGRLSGDDMIWVQGDSADSEKCREEIIGKIKQGKIKIEGAVLIGRHCQIDDGAHIVNSCIDNFTRIGKKAVITNSAVMDRAIVGDNTEIHDSIIGRHVMVNSNCNRPTRINAVSVVADDVVLEEGCTLRATKIYPHQHIRGEFQNQTIIAN